MEFNKKFGNTFLRRPIPQIPPALSVPNKGIPIPNKPLSLPLILRSIPKKPTALPATSFNQLRFQERLLKKQFDDTEQLTPSQVTVDRMTDLANKIVNLRFRMFRL